MSELEHALQAERQADAARRSDAAVLARTTQWLSGYPPHAQPVTLLPLPTEHAALITDYLERLTPARMTALWLATSPDGHTFRNHPTRATNQELTPTEAEANHRLITDWIPAGQTHIWTFPPSYPDTEMGIRPAPTFAIHSAHSAWLCGHADLPEPQRLAQTLAQRLMQHDL